MWVLEPVAASGEQQTLYLTSGDISIGRPLKKGSTVGKADILIFNEQSVSLIHATLHVEAATQQQEGGAEGFKHGDISITGELHASAAAATTTAQCHGVIAITHWDPQAPYSLRGTTAAL